MILTKEAILREIRHHNIHICPFNEENLGPASYDLTLSNAFRVYKKSSKVEDVWDDADHKKVTKLVKADSIVLRPSETILGITKERITLASDICGWLEGRSRFARLGLMIHISAPFMQPGISNHQVLEMTNMSKIPLRLHSGTKLCQFIFQRTEGKARYEGRFRDQTEP